VNVVLPLDRMTVAEKLGTMEVLWDDLCRRSDGPVSPRWQRELLAEREHHLRACKEAVHDWGAAKVKIRKTVLK
jgi:hypothetical protein